MAAIAAAFEAMFAEFIMVLTRLFWAVKVKVPRLFISVVILEEF